MRRFLLDTNVISEMRNLRGTVRVARYLAGLREKDLFVSVITMGEIQKGISKPNIPSDRRELLEGWFRLLMLRFEDRILGVDLRVALLWGKLQSERSRPVSDTLLVATAIVHDLTLVTRNVRDVGDTGARILNPWDA